MFWRIDSENFLEVWGVKEKFLIADFLCRILEPNLWESYKIVSDRS